MQIVERNLDSGNNKSCKIYRDSAKNIFKKIDGGKKQRSWKKVKKIYNEKIQKQGKIKYTDSGRNEWKKIDSENNIQKKKDIGKKKVEKK